MEYHNPVKLQYTNNWRQSLKESKLLLDIKNPVIITSKGNIKRHHIDRVFNPNVIFHEIKENPNFDDCAKVIEFCNNADFDSVIAIGGGSVMDLAKVCIAYLSTGESDVIKLIGIKEKYKKSIKSIFLPTTHGTGSEVTMWGTIWNLVDKKKYSISHNELYPDIAILDGNLTLTLSIDTSIITTLDALSHSFESIWNKNANDKSTEYAIQAIIMILSNIDLIKYNPNDIKVRNKLLEASCLAGLAFSNTKTAAAHSISYPLTIRFGIPHGIASSLTLIPLLKINKKYIQSPLNNILLKMNITFDILVKRIKEIPKHYIEFSLSKWGIQESNIPQLLNESFTKGRIDNNIVKLGELDITKILYKIL